MRCPCVVTDNAATLCSASSALSSSSSGIVIDKATGLQKDIDSVSLTASQLTASFYVLFAWMVVVTVSLLTVVVLGCRRWRRQRRRAAELEADDGCRSISDASSVCSRPASDRTAAGDRTVLEGVEIGRRASTQPSVDDALDNLTASVAEPWHVQMDTKNKWSSTPRPRFFQLAITGRCRISHVLASPVRHLLLSDCLANVACSRHQRNDLYCLSVYIIYLLPPLSVCLPNKASSVNDCLHFSVGTRNAVTVFVCIDVIITHFELYVCLSCIRNRYKVVNWVCVPC